ncbi:Pimeloyl-ACP methyl ester carboxylesterase [Saccharopolyspora shandongensis]|uniref:Pimeloyl-ACP methyl ester carboxylesterase n=1 Tax=Saccharopolyspora shandongensis TaxID=418495 RepID=A0A1H2R932_9PSEU|nr:alpha/beta hydrolase [Saccharopolyspora shandongensis]SDW15718.1 Pimeloyl-ACP methyl ester carboxylesterase [Saccharopolyspora shandongensis]
MNTIESVRVPVPDGELYAEVVGSGPPLVLLHADYLGVGMWDEQLELAADHRLIRYDARSHGRSTTAMADCRAEEDLLALLDHFEIGTASLMGNSMGGATTLTFALQNPERVDRVVLFGPGIPPVDFRDPFILEGHREQEAARQAMDIDRYVEAFLRIGVDGPHRRPDEVDPQIRARCRDMAMTTVGNHHTATGRLLERDVASRLAEIAAPTLLVVGELEATDLHRMARDAAERMPNAELVEMAGCGHMASMENPEEVNELIRRHLGG